MATSPPTSNTLHLLQPKPSVPRSIHLISDFDNTITRTDTIQTVISHSTHLNFPTIWKGLVSAYIQDYTSSIRNDDERGKCREIVRKNDDTNTTIPEYESMQERLREVELRSIERVETSGLLGKNVWRDINCGDVEEGNNLVKDVEMLDNEGWWETCYNVLYASGSMRSGTDTELTTNSTTTTGKIAIVSVNWSKSFIHHVLRDSLNTLPKDLQAKYSPLLANIRIIANEIQLQSTTINSNSNSNSNSILNPNPESSNNNHDHIGNYTISRTPGIFNADDKRRVLRQEVRACATTYTSTHPNISKHVTTTTHHKHNHDYKIMTTTPGTNLDTTAEEEKEGQDHTVIYIGDSLTDILCLTADEVNIGIIMGNDEKLLEMLGSSGFEVKDRNDTALHVHNDNVNLCNSGKEGIKIGGGGMLDDEVIEEVEERLVRTNMDSSTVKKMHEMYRVDNWREVLEIVKGIR